MSDRSLAVRSEHVAAGIEFDRLLLRIESNFRLRHNFRASNTDTSPSPEANCGAFGQMLQNGTAPCYKSHRVPEVVKLQRFVNTKGS
jgi:hypothetical protein